MRKLKFELLILPRNVAGGGAGWLYYRTRPLISNTPHFVFVHPVNNMFYNDKLQIIGWQNYISKPSRFGRGNCRKQAWPAPPVCVHLKPFFLYRRHSAHLVSVPICQSYCCRDTYKLCNLQPTAVGLGTGTAVRTAGSNLLAVVFY